MTALRPGQSPPPVSTPIRQLDPAILVACPNRVTGAVEPEVPAHGDAADSQRTVVAPDEPSAVLPADPEHLRRLVLLRHAPQRGQQRVAEDAADDGRIEHPLGVLGPPDEGEI